MKKIIYLFALFGCMQIVLAQQDSSYLPLAVGNYWKLGQSTVQLEWRVVGDTIFKNRGKYFILQGEFFEPEFVRKADNGDIITYFPQCDTEFVRYPFSFPFHQYHTGYHYSFPRFLSSDCGKKPEWADTYKSGDQIWVSSTLCDWRFKKAVGLFGYFDGWNRYYVLDYYLSKPSVKVETLFENNNNYTLYQNYPNPFNSQTKIRFYIKKSGHVQLDVYNILGQKIIALLNEEKSPGSYEVLWDSKNINKKNLSSGIYFYTLIINSKNNNEYYTETKSMFLNK